MRARTAKADELAHAASVSPTGRRVAFEARGDRAAAASSTTAARGARALAEVPSAGDAVDDGARRRLRSWRRAGGPPAVSRLDFIRTGGERRISNFLLWNLAYTELYFCTRCGRTSIAASSIGALANFSPPTASLRHDGRAGGR